METTLVAMDSENPSNRSQTKFMTLLSKNVHRTEIDKVEPKLWRFTLGTLILGHPVLLETDEKSNFQIFSKYVKF